LDKVGVGPRGQEIRETRRKLANRWNLTGTVDRRSSFRPTPYQMPKIHVPMDSDLAGKKSKRRELSRSTKLSEAARRLRRHVETLRIRVRDGRLKATRGPHGAYYVTAEALASLPRLRERPRPVVSPQAIEDAWDRGEQFLLRNRSAFERELKLYRVLREHPDRQPRLYCRLSVNRLRAWDCRSRRSVRWLELLLDTPDVLPRGDRWMPCAAIWLRFAVGEQLSWKPVLWLINCVGS
jgi:hypothetical protein